MHPAALVIGYVAVILAPLALAWAQGLPPRPWLDELSSGLALAAFAMLLVEFVLSGRFQPVSGRTGIDVTMRFHQLAARTVATIILVHPFLYSVPVWDRLPGSVADLAAMISVTDPFLTGVVAWILLLALVASALYRDRLPYRYEIWRLSHGLGAALIAALGAHHAVSAGLYSSSPALTGLWLALLAVAGLSLLVVYLIQPLRERARPYRVTSVRPVALRTIELAITPERGEVPPFEAGQFVWLNVGRGPFTLYENPFSISSPPGERASLRFVIKQVGDATRRLGTVAPGTRAYIDGPHGAATLGGRRGTGLALIAGGVGIAPMLSILRQLRRTGDTRPIKLVYGNRVAEQIVHGDELEAMAGELDLELIHVLGEPPPGWSGRTGVLDRTLLADLFAFPGARDWLYVACGPPPMIEAAEDALAALGVPHRRVVSEKFSYD